MQLTLEQQFEKRKLTDAVSQLNNKQLLEQLKRANNLLKQKAYVLDSFLQTQELLFVDTEDVSFKFKELLTHKEFETYNRKQLQEVLLNTLETIMHVDNQFRNYFFKN